MSHHKSWISCRPPGAEKAGLLRDVNHVMGRVLDFLRSPWCRDVVTWNLVKSENIGVLKDKGEDIGLNEYRCRACPTVYPFNPETFNINDDIQP